MESEMPHLLLYSLQGCFDGDPCLSTDMPLRVWSGLPIEVLERVLAKLPTPSLLRFRSVSKAWQSLLTSARFRELAASLGHPSAARPPVFSYQLVLRDHPPHPLAGLAAFSSCEVRKVDLTFLPAHALARPCFTSQDGLFCFWECDRLGSLTRTVVVNPMTRSWKTLPAGSVAMRSGWSSYWNIKLVTDKTSSSFKVHLFWETNLLWGFDVYSSSSDSWECHPRVFSPGSRDRHPQDLAFRGLEVQSGGSLYVYRSGEDLSVPMAAQHGPGAPHSVTIFSSATGRVDRHLLGAVAFSFHIRDLFLVDHENTVYFVVGFSDGLPPAPALRISKLDPCAPGKWEPVSLFTLSGLSSIWLPRARANLECGDEFTGLGCAVGLGDSIWISVGVFGEWHVIEFRIPDQSWHPVLRGPLLPDSDHKATLWHLARTLVQPQVALKI